ncbi:efflux RND transporter permease subunit [Chromatium okenii]|uniref:efflux RND transporter permease subunit n=1 Tax=Chromatium okenii TaxID=61644 RepID=UPI001F5BE2D1|nr:efflux RND transporter permease subunit [Chromatium okenii]
MKHGLIAIFARHRLLANLLMGSIFILGTVALLRMNVQYFPNFALDVISVRVVWSGAAAEDVENGILLPLEERLKTVDGLKKLNSTARRVSPVAGIGRRHGYVDCVGSGAPACERIRNSRKMPKRRKSAVFRVMNPCAAVGVGTECGGIAPVGAPI